MVGSMRRVPRFEGVKEVEAGKHPGYHIVGINGRKYIRDNPDRSTKDNVNPDCPFAGQPDGLKKCREIAESLCFVNITASIAVAPESDRYRASCAFQPALVFF